MGILQTWVQKLTSATDEEKEVLDWSDKNITDKGIETRFPKLQNPQKKKLNLSYNYISDKGAMLLLSVLPRNITSLDFSNCDRIGDETGYILLNFAKNGWLTEIDLSGTKVSSLVVNRINQALAEKRRSTESAIPDELIPQKSDPDSVGKDSSPILSSKSYGSWSR